MGIQKKRESNTPPAKIIGIQFGLLSPDDIRRSSVVEITTRDTYINNKPVANGLFDPRMGVIESGIICPTDGEDYMTSPGYFGHIELAKPVFYAQYISTVIKILRSTCYKCGALLIDKNTSNVPHSAATMPDKRWNHVFALASKVGKGGRCGDATVDGCGCKQPFKISKEGLATVVAEWKDMNGAGDDGGDTIKFELTPEHVVQMLRRITDEDLTFMGFNPVWARPEWMICQVLAVPPPAVRPSVRQDSSQRSEDDLTHIIINILKTNETIKEKIAQNAEKKAIDGWHTVLQYYVATMVDNNIAGVAAVTQRSGRPLKSIKERLGGKDGRVRGNLMGKRVDFSARSVITPDANLSVRELGIPIKIARNITKPVLVNATNIDFLTKLVRNGPDIHPGAKIVERASGENISLKYIDRNSFHLEMGDTVHRHMLDGDGVLFNRQPTLHRMSMMCHLARIMPIGDTFRMNVADTKPYNADFDGDEMNLHMPQDDEAESELKNLAAVPYQMISPANNKPIVGIFQDSLLGSYQITRENVQFTHREAMNLLMHYDGVDASMFPSKTKLISSFDVMKQIMPKLTLKYNTKRFVEGTDDPAKSNNVLEIENGEYRRGQMEKGVLGDSSAGLLHRIYNDYGSMASAKFVDDLQNVVTRYMCNSAFSVGIGDLIADDATNTKIMESITEKKIEVGNLIDQTHLGIFENKSGKDNLVEFETQINNILNKASQESGKIGKGSLDKDNRFVIMVNAGSKGSEINISQMISCLGQQNVDGKRIPYGYEDRTLPHFPKYDDSPLARGFIESSFISGLSPTELFFHAMGGREGLIDTAVKTSTTGYIARRLVKLLEDVSVRYDMTVRDHGDRILQYTYGDDGFDTIRVENQIFPLTGMSITDIYSYFHMDNGVINYTAQAKKRMNDAHDKAWMTNEKDMIDTMLAARKDIIDNVCSGRDSQKVHLPVSFKHLISNVKGNVGIKAHHKIDVTPNEVFNMCASGLARLERMKYNAPSRLFKILYNFHLSPKNLIENYGMNKRGIVMLVERVISQYMKSVVAPGEMVGIIAAQSISEPTTQMTLNTFHFAGVASKSNVTRGVPRMEEILSLTENTKNPSCEVALKMTEEHDRENVRKLIPKLENTRLRDIVKKVDICFDPDDTKTLMDTDVELMKYFSEFDKLVVECNGGNALNGSGRANDKDKSKWIMRIVFDEVAMYESNVTMEDIHYVLKNGYEDAVQCVYSDTNDEELIFRIRTKILGKGKTNMTGSAPLDQADEIYALKCFQDNLMNNTMLRGVNGLGKVIPRKIMDAVVYNASEGVYEIKEKWVVDTTGTNLLGLLGCNEIDPLRTTTNDIQETFNVLGVEAARRTIFNEVKEVLEFDDSYLNNHHLSLLCDRMTCNETMTAVSRHGINNDDNGPLAKASFEETPEMFLRAARHGELDGMRGVSANIMCGQEGAYGTNAFQVVLDLDAISNIAPTVENVIEDKINIENALNGLEFGEGDACSANTIGVSNNVHTIKATDMGTIDEDYDAGF